MNNTIKVSAANVGVSEKTLLLGKQCENLAREISFDVNAWVKTYGNGDVTLSIMRHDDISAYAVALERNEKNITTWSITDTDTAKAGGGTAELRYSVGESIVISETFPFYVYESDTAYEGVPPEPYESWVEKLISLEEKAERAIEGAANAAAGKSAYDIAVENGFDGTETEWLASLIGKTGERGAKGDTGAAGHSPAITATKSGSLTKIFADNVQIATVNDGAKGDTGAAGAAGHSPAITATKSGTVTKIYADGVQIATVNDGAKGDTGAAGAAGHSPAITATKSGTITKIFADGVQIATVNDGAKGDTGVAGAQGLRGLQGLKGDDGASAYESAQEGGYSGTEAQFYADLAALDGLAAALAEI